MRNHLLLALLAFSAIAPASAESLSDSLLHCDSRFFHQLKVQQANLKKSAPLQNNQDIAWFSPNKTDEDITWFSQPVQMNNIKAIGYFERYHDLKELGKYYYWGFVMDRSAASVVAAMPQVNWKQAGEDYITNPKIKLQGNNDWQDNNTAVSGIAPATDSAEKLAMLSDDSAGRSHMLCTIQGKVTDEMLYLVRPDLAERK